MARIAVLSIVSVILPLAAMPAVAQPTAPYPVDNLDREPTFAETEAPSEFMALGERTLFMAHGPGQGRGLWVTDGTPEGTRFLLDLCPGGCLTRLAVHQVTPQLAFFSPTFVDPGPFDRRAGLWRSDGTAAGTYAVTQLEVWPVGYLAGSGRFVFSARTADLGREPWVTDGTPGGTVPLGDLFPGGDTLGSTPGAGAAVGDVVVFPAGVPGSGRELWATDGTAAGTRLVADLDGAATSSEPSSFRQAGSFVLFVAGASSERDLWATDGTAAGTRRLLEGVLTEFGIDDVEVVGSRAYLAFGTADGYEIWSTDGTPAGTAPVLPPGLWGINLQPFGDRLFLIAGPQGTDAFEPWVTDGTPAGTRRLADLCPGACGSFPSYLGIAGGRLVFSADDGTHGRELWSTDGTAAGTRMLRDLCPGSCDAGRFVQGFEIGGLVFAADFDAVVATDGTPGGTVRLPIGEPQPPIGAAGDLALIVKGSFPGPWELLASDGTVAGTLPLTDFDPPIDGSSEPTGLVELGGEALFLAFRDDRGDRVDLMASRGRPGATRTVLAIPGGSGGLADTRRAGDRVYFLQHPFSTGAELWITDGTAAGTVPLGDAAVLADAPWGSLGEDLLAYGHGNGVHRLSGPPYQDTLLSHHPRPPHLVRTKLPEEHFVHLGGRVLIANSEHWWSTDGTPAGTAELAPPPGSSGLIQNSGWTPWGDELFYLDRFRGLWATDGVPGHTRRVCPALWDMEVALHLFALDGGLIFSVAEPPFSTDPVAGLWTSDGQSGCQRAVPGVSIESSGLLAGVAAVLGGRLFFSSDDGLHGEEPWVSDGTAAGTRLLADLNPGPAESRPHRMRVVGGRLFFSANDGAHGYELWSTDGTREGTVRHGDVAPGAWSSHPDELTAVGDRLLFTADDGTHGRELWALPLAIPDCADPETLCLQQDRFRFQVRWRDQRTGEVGGATALPFPGSDRTGMFWFFDAANVELLVKVLNGGPVNGFQWVFYGALSDVEYWINVTDAETGLTRTYRNPPGTVCGRGDTTAFPSSPAAASEPASGAAASSASLRRPAPESGRGPVELAAAGAAAPRPAPGSGGCQPGPETLCLLGGRFRVTVDWHDQRSGDSGVGGAIPGTDKSGFFWFFNSSNVELMFKVLDGRSVNGSFWVFYGALSDVEYTIRVVDTQTAREETYHSPPGEICGRADTTAF